MTAKQPNEELLREVANDSTATRRERLLAHRLAIAIDRIARQERDLDFADRPIDRIAAMIHGNA